MGAEESPIVSGLARSLRRGPPLPSHLVSLMQSSEAYARFLELVREYLPEHEREILAESSEWGRIAAFINRFADGYFPLDEGAETYEDFIAGIPVLVQGISYDAYHEMPSYWRPGLLLMTYLVESPYEDEGRVALGEECLGYVSQALLWRVPQRGFSPETLEQIVSGSRYQALGSWARILWHSTGRFFLDVDFDSLAYEDLSWDRETVESLTQDWLQAEATVQAVFQLAEWLEEDPPTRFEEMLSFTLGGSQS